jgi:hypothetical protein
MRSSHKNQEKIRTRSALLPSKLFSNYSLSKIFEILKFEKYLLSITKSKVRTL